MSDGALEVEVLAPDGTVLHPQGSSPLGHGVRLATIALVVLALAGAGAFGVSRLTASADADRAESVVRRLVEALASGDVDGALATVRPGEREALEPTAAGLAAQLGRFGVDGEALGAVGLTLPSLPSSDATYRVEDRGDLAFVRVESGRVDDGDSEVDGVPIGVVDEDGAWYVSPWYTAAELARLRAGLAVPVRPVVEPGGARSPDDLPASLVDAARGADAAALVALIDPVEAAALYDYSVHVVPPLEAALRRAGDRLAALADVDIAPAVEIDAGVATVEVGDVSVPMPGGADLDSIEVVAVERDGRWYLSPGRTVLGAMAGVVDLLTEGDLGALLDAARDVAPPLDGDGAAVEPAAPAPVPDEIPAYEPVGPGDARVDTVIAALPTELDGLGVLGYFDDAYEQRYPDATLLTVSRVFQLRVGFADITVSEGDLARGGESTSVAGQPALLDRFGDGVVLSGPADRFLVQVSVFGLDAGLEAAETAARDLFADVVAGLGP